MVSTLTWRAQTRSFRSQVDLTSPSNRGSEGIAASHLLFAGNRRALAESACAARLGR